MARWLLTAAHYISVPGNEWEYKETDRNTGKQARTVAEVPRYLDPKDPSDCNRDGDVIVCWEGKGERHDIVFRGPPTPDMDPLDDEARRVTAELEASGAWRKPEEGEAYGENLIKQFMAQIDRLAAKGIAPTPVAVSENQVDPKAFAEMQAQIKALMEQNAQLMAQVLKADGPVGDEPEEVIAPPPTRKPAQVARRI